MDSKLKRLCIIASFSVILLAVVLVVGLNNYQTAATTKAPVEPTKAPAEVKVELLEGQIGDDLSAFLKDYTFFDHKESDFVEKAKSMLNRLSIIVTSVEKDLRIQVVDSTGKPVTGESFYIEVEELGEYKDLDKDGILYIGDMDAGDYLVSLKPIDGYKVPISATKVHVKEKV